MLLLSDPEDLAFTDCLTSLRHRQLLNTTAEETC